MGAIRTFNGQVKKFGFPPFSDSSATAQKRSVVRG
jgi:hypothetical protein